MGREERPHCFFWVWYILFYQNGNLWLWGNGLLKRESEQTSSRMQEDFKVFRIDVLIDFLVCLVVGQHVVVLAHAKSVGHCLLGW